MTAARKPGSVPVYLEGVNDKFFFKDPTKPMEYVMYTDGSGRHVATGAIVPGVKFDIWALCKQEPGQELRNIVIDAIVYRDVDGSIQEYSREHQAIAVDRRNWEFGFVSKLAGLRWGFTLSITPETGESFIHVDLKSPILGIKFHFE
ncbi:hypothetical protein AVT69_gp324 [Pseudomonas phage PhiPA3]|uniref:Uncharacterized protein 326 n=1 Tax=Pseudomonas phage PhiPA3 TaxID=998086 RepID=F8SJG2_BPPA3|nr:hypothetical protein AVT69_gp324 [Pseudomonas phage PhiPA3]AEH03749.1 hypothetical protein [Pseudomonas phage PhiPA3]